MSKPIARYSIASQAIHWTTVILVLAAYVFSEGGPESRVYSASFDFTRRLHESFGLAVLVLALLRLLWRMVDRRPSEPPMPAWMLLASRLLQGVLYLLLLAVPLTAIIGAWLEGHPVTSFAGDIPTWIGASPSLGLAVSDLHALLGNLILWAAGAHAAAALFHHLVLRDDVLRTMLPGPRV